MSRIVIKDLYVKYPNSEDYALNNVNFEFKLGKLYLITGKSGSGKSTFGKVITGIIPQIEKAEVFGEINVLNHNPLNTNIYEFAKIATYISQSPYDQVISGYVEDELMFVLENLGELNFNKIDTTLKYLGIEDLKNKKIDELSGGQIQKLVIANILLLNSKVIILDEPFAHLDPKSSRDLMELLIRLKSESKCIILIEHRLKDLVNYFNEIDNVILIDEGKVIDAFPGCEIYKKTQLLKEYGLRIPINLELSLVCKIEICDSNDLKPIEVIVKQLSIPEKIETKLAENTSPIVEVFNLWFAYFKNNFVLKNINLKLNSSTVYTVLGPNASGKSTLLLNIAGILRPRKGFVKVLDKIIKSTKDTAGIVGYIPQNPDLVLMFESVEKEIKERAKSLIKSEIELSRFTLELARTLRVNDYLFRNPHSLSRGQRFRVALAATLALKPKILLLDETTTGQDEECISILGELIKNYVVKNNAVALIATHDIDFACNYTQKAIVLHNGQIYAIGNTIDILSRDDVVNACNLVKPITLEIFNKYGVKPVPDKELLNLVKLRGICYGEVEI